MATLMAWQYIYSSNSAWMHVLFWGVLFFLCAALPVLVFVGFRRHRKASVSPTHGRRNAVLLALGLVEIVPLSIAGFFVLIEFNTTAPVATGPAALYRDHFAHDTGIWSVGSYGDIDIKYDHGRLALAVSAPDRSVATRVHFGLTAGLTVQVQVGGGRLDRGDVVGVLCGTKLSNPSRLEEYALTVEVGPHGPAAINLLSRTESGQVTGNEPIASRRIPTLPANGPLTLRAQCKPGSGPVVQLWINGKLAVAGGLSPDFDGYTWIGLYTYSAKGNTRALFDNLVVSPTN